MQTADLIRELEAMPQDFPVHFWANGQRREIIEARNVGDCVDLYEEDDQHEADTRANILDALYLRIILFPSMTTRGLPGNLEEE